MDYRINHSSERCRIRPRTSGGPGAIFGEQAGFERRGALEERTLFAGPGRFTDVAWSPDGEWLLLAWRDADQWLFIRPSDEKPSPISNISRQFDPGEPSMPPFPRLDGWCCPP